jgi:predicted dehydrogenase
MATGGIRVNKKYKAAVIGTGFIGAGSHVPAYQVNDRCELVAIADIKPGSAKYVAERNGIERYYTDPQQMLEEVRPDVVSVCVPNMTHGKWSIAALEAGANVLCEKPISVNIKEARKIYTAAKKAGRCFMPIQNDRMGPRTVIRDMIKKGALGEVYFGECENIRRRGIPNWGTFHIKAANFGGPFCDVGVHFIDSVLYMLGNPAFKAISGKTWTKIAPNENDKPNLDSVDKASYFIPRHYSSKEYTVEDHAAGTLLLGDDILINFKFSWALNSPPFDGIRLNGTKGGIVFDKYASHPFMLYSHLGEIMTDTVLDLKLEIPPKFGAVQNPSIGLLVEHFLDTLDGKNELLVSEAEALNVVTVIEGFYKSAELGHEVTAEDIIGS